MSRYYTKTAFIYSITIVVLSINKFCRSSRDWCFLEKVKVEETKKFACARSPPSKKFVSPFVYGIHEFCLKKEEMEQTFTFREAEIPQELVRIAAEEEIRSSQKVVIDESSPKLSTGDTSATVAQQSRSSRSGFKRQSVGARGGKRPVPPLKKRKVLLMKCSHEGQHFEKGFIDESMNMSQV